MTGVAGMLPFPRRFSLNEPKGNSCSQITNRGPSGCAPPEVTQVSAEQGILTTLTGGIHDISFRFFLPLRSWQCLCEAGTRGKRGKALKRPRLLQLPTAWGTWCRYPAGKSSGKAPGREQPFIAHTTGVISSSCDFSNALTGRVK